MRILSVLLLLSLQSFGQHNCNYRISGKITEAATGSPLPGAGIQLTGTDRIVLSDEQGDFALDSVCGGQQTLEVRYTGYKVLRWTGTIQRSVQLDLRAVETSASMNELVVVAEKSVNDGTVITDTLSREEMDRSMGKSLADYLKQIAGVTTLQSGNSVLKPVIHGMHSQRVLILNAGVRQEGQQWGMEHAPEIDPFIAGRMKVIKGAASVLYGADAIGGVILVEPREMPHAPGLNAELNLAGMSNGRQGVVSGLVEQHLGKFYDVCWRIQGTAKKAGTIRTPDVYLQNTAFNEYDWSAGLGIERKTWGAEAFFSSFNAETGVFTGSHIGNLSDLQRILNSGEIRTDNRFTYSIGNPRQKVQHRLFSLETWLRAGKAGKIHFQYGYQFNHRFEYDLHKPLNDSLAALDRPQLELKLYTQTADVHFESVTMKGFSITAGLNGLIQDNQYGGIRYFVPNYKLYNGGAYTLLRFLHRRWELEAGGRLDYRDQTVYRNVSNAIVTTPFRFTNPVVSAGAAYRHNEQLKYIVNIGTAYRPPSINEWFSEGLHHGTATYESGDSLLDVEKAITLTAGLTYSARKFSLDASVFYTRFSNYIYLAPDVQPVLTISGAFPSYRFKGVEADIKGIDVTMNVKITSRINLQSRNSAVFAWNRSDDRYLELVPAPRFEQILEYHFKDAGKWKEIRAGFSVLAVLRQERYTPGTDYAVPPQGYLLPGLDASANCIVRSQELRIGISVMNLFNQRYRDYMNRQRYYTDEAGINIQFRITVPLTFTTAEHDHQH